MMNKVKWWDVNMVKPPLVNHDDVLFSKAVLAYDIETNFTVLVSYYGDDEWVDDCGHNHYPTHWTDLPSTGELNN